MINIDEELDYYEKLQRKIPVEEKDIFQYIDNKLLNVEKVVKLQQKTYHVMEDLVEQLEEDHKNSLNTEKETKAFLMSIIEILDIFDETDRFFYENKEEVLRRQFKLQRDKVQVILSKIGLFKIDHALDKQLFDRTIHSVVQTVHNIEQEDQEIAVILKSGYIYNNQVIRKAQVVVNIQKKELENE